MRAFWAKSGFTLVVLLCPFGPLLGQTTREPSCPPPDSLAGMGAIVGRVVDGETEVPLGFVQLRLRVAGIEAPIEGLSNSSGYFKFCSVPTGSFTLTGQLGQLGGLKGPMPLGPGKTGTIELELSAPAEEWDTGTLTGTVFSSDSGKPVEGVAVLLLSLGQTAISNVKGNFTFPSLPPAEYEIQLNRLGYAEATSRVEVESRKTVHTRVEMTFEPVPLDPLTVTAVRRRVLLPGLEDVERRYHSGWGQWVLANEIQVRSPRRLSDVLDMTGTTVHGSLGFEKLRIRRTGCGPLVYLDDILVTRCPRGGGPKPPAEDECNPEREAFDVVNMIHPMDVVAVEVYRGPAEIPGKYIDSNARCGVILVWTRRGRISGGGGGGS